MIKTGKAVGSSSIGMSQRSSRPDNVLSKLFLRELYGTKNKRSGGRIFTRIPGRLAFCLKDVIPESAFLSGHIFLGFSKCGQFLLSYTQTAVDMAVEDPGDDKYHYRLHWWLFLPYARAKKVAEVMLFSNEGAPGNLHLNFCQWPNSLEKALIYGLASYREEGEYFANCYITVTTAPSLKACQECVQVASSYEEDDMAEAWNSCVRLSCLQHGLTLHTSFGLLPPHPRFEPKISMKRDGFVIFNTGNILHSLNVSLEGGGGASSSRQGSVHQPSRHTTTSGDEEDDSALKSSSSQLSMTSRWAQLELGESEYTFAAASAKSPSRGGSSNHQKQQPFLSQNIHEDEPFSSPFNSPLNNERLQRAAEFVNQLNHMANHPGRSTSPSIIQSVLTRLENTSSSSSSSGGGGQSEPCTPSTSSGQHQKKIAAEKAYEINEHDFESEGIQENLSTFRRKRLADKKYELTDDDFDGSFIQEKLSTFRKKRKNAENLSPSSPEGPKQPIKSPRSTSEVLRPLSSNPRTSEEEEQQQQQVLYLSAEIPEQLLMSPGGMVNKKKDMPGGSPSHPSNGASSPPSLPPRMLFKYTRRYIETDDELSSILTDIEPDEDESAGRRVGTGEHCCHNPLPLEIHGSAYQPLAPISNLKAERLGGKCIKVQQRSLDLELLCFDVAQKLCRAAPDKNYWFCNNYDVEIVDVNPESGDVICVAVILVLATVVTKTVSPLQKISISSLTRRQFQGGFKFCWNVEDSSCELVDSEPLKEINAFKRELQGSSWHPAASISQSLQRQLGLHEKAVKSMTNESAIGGTSLKTIVDPEHVVAIVLDSLD